MTCKLQILAQQSLQTRTTLDIEIKSQLSVHVGGKIKGLIKVTRGPEGPDGLT